MSRIITVNVGPIDFRKTLADLNKVLRHKPDYILFEELGNDNRARAIRRALNKRGYGFVRKKSAPNTEQSCIGYRRKGRKIIWKRTWFLAPATDVGRRGAGPRVLRRKSLTWILVELPNKSKEAIGVFHLAPSIYIPKRLTVWQKEIDNVEEWVNHIQHLGDRGKPIAITVGGDTNNTREHRFDDLLDLGLHVSRRIGTHGKNPFDRIFTSEHIVRTFSFSLYSDHDALGIDTR